MSAAYIKQVAAAALQRFDDVMLWLGLGGGKNRDKEYLPLNPKRSDHKPGSFTINRNSGKWMDGATDDRGSDLVALAAWVWNMKQGEAAAQLGSNLGMPEPPKSRTSSQKSAGNAMTPPAPEKPPSNPPNKPDDPVCVMPVPADAPKPPKAHAKHGKPSGIWAYRAPDGAVMFYHCRFDPKAEGERKQFAPLTLWRDAAGALIWQWKAPPAPRPIFGLDALAAQPDDPVCIVEGEKAADAAAELLPGCVIMTWQGGAQAVDKADWKPLAGRVVWLWPDNDDPGRKAMQKLADILHGVGVASVRMINLAILEKQPGADACTPLAQGDDAADLLERGWAAEHLAQLVSAPGFLLDVPQKTTSNAASKKDPKEQPPSPPAKPYFLLEDGGVYFVNVDKGAYHAPRWICTRLDVLAMVRDPNNHGWGRLVAFNDPDGKLHRVIIPMELFKGEALEVAGLLLQHGLTMAPKARPLVVEYLQTQPADKRARITQRTGWHGRVYVLPDQAFGSDAEEWIFESESPGISTFKQHGTLAEWRDNVAALCRGNSRLLFAVSVAFAAPLLHPAGAESGGFHFRSNSSDGKTTALRVAASVCGGADYMQRWRATDNGLEALAMQHCDAPLLLDELAQLDAKVAGEVAYMLANGSGKTRAGRTGGARERAHWRLLFLSAGEVGLAQHMGEAGKSPRAGQELRLAEIPADAGAGLGVFENLHGHANGSEFSKALGGVARTHYGSAWIEYMRKLVELQAELPDTLQAAVKVFERQYLSEQASGQARRVAARFALVGAAGELATSWGITGWNAGEAMQACGVCFKAWMDGRGGEGNHEERAILAQVREFLERHGEARFTDWHRPVSKDDHAPRVMNKAGFRKHDDLGEKTEYFVYPEVFKTEVCKGYDHKAVARLLMERGCITGEKERPDAKKALPGEGYRRVYHILSVLWEDEDA